MGKLFAVVALLVAIACIYLMWDPFDPECVRGKRVLVTGASSGIGEQLAYRYAALGARLLVTARRLPLLEKVAARCRELGAPLVEVVATDMTAAQDRAAIVRRAEDRLGRLDHLILNHAVLRHGTWTGSAINLTDLQQDLTTNFLSHVDLASKALPLLSRSRGNIGVVSSGFGEIGVARGTTYGANKHALHGFFSSWRQELRHRNVPVSITICVLGPVDTDTVHDIFFDGKGGGLPSVFMTSPERAADAIIRGVVARIYKFRHNWTIAFLLALNDLFYVYGENLMNWYLYQMANF